MSFGEAAAEGEMQAFGLDELPSYYDGAEGMDVGADGAVARRRGRIAMRPTPGARPGSALPRAPLAGLTESGPNGLLPIVAANGRTPAQAYARPLTHRSGTGPSIAIVIGGLGFNARATTQAIDELPPEVTLSFVPYAQDLQSWIDRARARGHEVMLELPMEPFDPDADDTGPQTLLATAPRRNRTRSVWNTCCRAGAAISASPITRARGLRLPRKRRSRWCRRCAGAASCSSPAASASARRFQRRSPARGPAQHRRRPHHRCAPRSRRDRRAIAQSRSAGAAKSKRHRRRFRVSRDHGAGRPLGA